MKLSEECIGTKVRVNGPDVFWNIHDWFIPEYQLSSGHWAGISKSQGAIILNDMLNCKNWEYYKEPEKLLKKKMYAPVWKRKYDDSGIFLGNFLLDEKLKMIGEYDGKKPIGYCELTVYVKEDGK